MQYDNQKVSEKIVQRLKAYSERISYYDFVKEALYAPEVGYYIRSNCKRVGYSADTDFYTAVSLNTSVFQKIILGAACHSLPKELDPKDTQWVELGSEPNKALLQEGAIHSFESFRTIRIGEDFDTLSGNLILFSNELLDAQPFHRLRFEQGKWVELGVCIKEDLQLEEKVLVGFSKQLTPWLDSLPKGDIEEGYCLDMPTGSIELLEQLIKNPWKGSLLFLDYGKKWEELAYGTFHGTARGYERHKMVNNILHNPGLMDITCHICWDWCEIVLKKYGFQDVQVQSQEAFFLKQAADVIQSIMHESVEVFSKERQSLLQLLHPGHMGQKFQVLFGRRV